MANGAIPQDVSDTETLARFVVFRRWVREDNTVKPDAFIPHPYPDLSVTRHIGLSMQQLWDIGKIVAAKRSLSLNGRADIDVCTIQNQELSVEASCEEGNSNHANVKGWPPTKPEQKIKALEIARTAVFFRHTT